MHHQWLQAPGLWVLGAISHHLTVNPDTRFSPLVASLSLLLHTKCPSSCCVLAAYLLSDTWGWHMCHWSPWVSPVCLLSRSLPHPCFQLLILSSSCTSPALVTWLPQGPEYAYGLPYFFPSVLAKTADSSQLWDLLTSES